MLANVPVHFEAWRPSRRDRLLIGEQTRRGRCLVTVVDLDTWTVSVVEPWEHALLLLCDGTRSLEALVELHTGRAADEIEASLDFFGRRGLLDNPRSPPIARASIPLEDSRLLRLEWDNAPEQSSQIRRSREEAPFIDPLIGGEDERSTARVVAQSLFEDV